MAGGPLGRWAFAEDAHPHWSPRQRFWLWLNVSLTCWLATGVTLSVLHAPPLAGPLDWIAEVANATASEMFFGARIYKAVDGPLSGTGWIAFNALDLILFFGLGLIVLGVVVEKRLGLDGYQEDVEEDAEQSHTSTRTTSTTVGSPQTISTCRFARRLFFIQWIAIALMFTGFQVRREPSLPIRFDPIAQERLRELTGRYVFDDGRQLKLAGPTYRHGRDSEEVVVEARKE